MRRDQRRSALFVGLGRTGSEAARRLVALGWDVVGIDKDPEVIRSIQDELEHVVQMDAGDEEALASVGVADFSVCVVSRGHNVESGILIVLNLQQLGAKQIVAKTASEHHARILRRIGVQKIIFPERDAGVRLAESLESPHLAQWMQITSEVELAVVRVPKGRSGSTLESWSATRKPELEILGHLAPDGTVLKLDQFAPLQAGELLIVVGKTADILALGE